MASSDYYAVSYRTWTFMENAIEVCNSRLWVIIVTHTNGQTSGFELIQKKTKYWCIGVLGIGY